MGHVSQKFMTRIKLEGRKAEVVAFRSAVEARLLEANPELARPENRRQRTEAVYAEVIPAFPQLAAGEEVVEPGPVVREKAVVAEKAADKKVRKVVEGWGALLEAGLGVTERRGIQADVEWVYQNLGVEPQDVDPGSVPCAGAVELLRAAKFDKPWFFTTYHAKLLPTKAKLEHEGWFAEDDGELAESISAVLSDREQAILHAESRDVA